jgi:hypothetical protein
MRFGKRRPDAEPVAEPTGVTAPPEPASWTVARDAAPPAAEAEAVVDSEAVELPAESPAPAAAYMPPVGVTAAAASPYAPPAPPFPVAEEPVAVATAGSEAGGVAPLGEAAPFYAGGHAHGTAPSWPEPVMALASERPEAVVGAAFVGGILLAAIVRRLGS